MNNEKLRAISDYLKGVLNLSDHVDLAMADKNIRGSILFRGPNVYILAFAIVIASVGLNVNSIPVIIGAMLVSPLMGPIFGATLGFGTNDMKLIISSLKNLGLMVGISIVASTFYFVLTPLDLQNPTELLARTNPTVYDVLIALFGGAAGMLETARKEKGTVLSGVAIATALMPPLCTVGFGIATLNWHYTLGALYLFCINCVFISLAGFLVVKLLRFPVIRLADPRLERRRRWAIGILLLLILVPSIVSAISVIQNNKRDIAVSHFIDEHKTMGNSYIYDHKTLISGKWLRKETTVEIYMAGESLAADQRSRLIDEAEQLGFTLTIKDGATSQFLSERELVNMIYEQKNMLGMALVLKTHMKRTAFCLQIVFCNEQSFFRSVLSIYNTFDRKSCNRWHWGLLKNSLGVFSSMMIPSSINSTFVPTSRAKPISWVTTTMVMPLSASSFITSKTSPTISGSSAEVGSSKSITLGFMARERTMAILCFCPPESWLGNASAFSFSPTLVSSVSAFSLASSFPISFSFVGARMILSIMDRLLNRLKFWNTIPIWVRTLSISTLGSVMSWPSNQIAPLLGVSKRFRHLKKVLFPEPEGPTITIFSPWWT